MSRTVRSFAVLALAVWFLAGTVPAAAAPLFGSGAQESVWSAAWDWLVGLFAGSEAGGGIDPDGQTVKGVNSQSDAGCAIDPNGRPVCSGSMSNAGGAIDPNG